jgi:hypothetical protein
MQPYFTLNNCRGLSAMSAVLDNPKGLESPSPRGRTTSLKALKNPS